ncbi:TetR/AcrR family transcriptional regulator [Streptomyces johnsoniae]|uniref:Helix-turn-helix domain-containing protein n=1 Tax=Streptomyces johnsoniae TaxID=3075532 RepID=A0ABU2S8J1_9ACTN|nr:helix-turn-helix domain-containing protein [Streptomyces sp. DSM 41886]MDT0445302.1 helix-turn-helix domain-containing protein [Streptomyces sp. DSM 41886]
MRADARRNRDRLLAEAEAVFRERGSDASLEAVARRAGVAIGTLYGHFPTRKALLEALLRDRQDAVFRLGDRLRDADRTGAALAEWITAVTEHAATYRGLAAQLLGSLDDETSELNAACRRMSEAGQHLVARATAAGDIRPDTTADDVFALISAAAWLRDQVPPAQADRLLTYMIDGLARG